MSKAKNLEEARTALAVADDAYQKAIGELYGNAEYKSAAAAWKDGHEKLLALKKAHNAVYAFLGELKPKKADKLKPGGKLDRPDAKPEGAPEKPSTKKGRKAAEFKARGNDDEPAMSDAASDEPEDEDKNAP